MKRRCDWATSDPLMRRYHDAEWGVPVRNDRKMFELLVLEGMQAGLSWLIVLRKRESFRLAFDGFDPQRVARYGRAKVRGLLQDAGIIRNRLKIDAAITNAQAFLRVQGGQRGSFHRFLWEFVDGRPIVNRWKHLAQLPATSKEPDMMSGALKALGFRFAGSTICYAHMQSAGMVNDHLVHCFRHPQLAKRA